MFPWNCSFFPWTPPSLQQLLFQKIGVQILNDPSRKNLSIIGQRMSECHRWNYHFPLWRMYMLSHQYKWRTVHCSHKLLAICFRWINKSHDFFFVQSKSHWKKTSQNRWIRSVASRCMYILCYHLQSSSAPRDLNKLHVRCQVNGSSVLPCILCFFFWFRTCLRLWQFEIGLNFFFSKCIKLKNYFLY
jgi:hypothetical protein